PGWRDVGGTVPYGIECARLWSCDNAAKGAVRMTIIRVGLDTSKHVFQIHGVDEKEQPMLRRQSRRSEVEKVFAKLPPTRNGLEACGASHHWAGAARLRARGDADPAAIHQSLRQARQERCDRCRSDLRSDEPPDDAVC